MTTWIAVYRGDSVPTAKVIAVTSEPSLVETVAKQLLNEDSESLDPILNAADRGRQQALRLIATNNRQVQRGRKR